jgi:hypothetical protein
MALKQTSRYCDYCGQYTLHTCETFSGAWGCLLTILTGGLFLIPWIILAIFDQFKPWRCQRCGGGRHF